MNNFYIWLNRDEDVLVFGIGSNEKDVKEQLLNAAP